MKKREKFLLSFLISWFVVMSLFIANKVHTARYYSLHGKELEEWFLIEGDVVSYDNLTDEAKEYLKSEIKEKEEREKIAEIEEEEYCNENPDICAESEILGAAGDYYSRILGEYSMAGTNYEKAELLLVVAIEIIMLTLIVYFSITIEFKVMKKYCVDNLKVLLAMFGLMILSLICNIVLRYIAGVYYADYLDVSYDISICVELTVLSYCAFLIPNIIINIVKSRKSKNKDKVEVSKNKK